MAQFQYRAVTATGSVVDGRLEAVHQQDLIGQLSRLGMTLVRAKAISQRAGGRGAGAVDRRQLIVLVFHLEMMSRAGVPIPTAIADLRDSADNEALRSLAAGMYERIQNGESVAQALQAYPKVFSPSVVNLIKAGEQSGELTRVLGELLRSLKWTDELAAKLKKLMSYPIFVGTVIVVVVFFLMIYLVPQMTSFIKTMGKELPLHTKALIATSNFVKQYWWAILTVPPAVGFGIAHMARRNRAFRYRLHALLLRLPLAGGVVQKLILARVLDTLGLMYAAGIPLLEALGHCAQTTTNLVIHDAILRVQKRLGEGTALADAFAEQGLFPALVIRMMRVGETTGALDEALRNVNYFFNRDIDEAMARVEASIEPAMTVIMGALLGWIMLSVLGPIYDLISTLKM
jgi:type IV pilus assembly protein PilC